MGTRRAGQGRTKRFPLFAAPFQWGMAPAVLGAGVGALSSRAFAGPSNLPLWLSHIGLPGNYRCVVKPTSPTEPQAGTCLSVPPFTCLHVKSSCACKFKTSYIALDRVAHISAHICTAAEFKHTKGYKYLCKSHMLWLFLHWNQAWI